MKSIKLGVEVAIFLIILNVLKLECGTLEPCFHVENKRLDKEQEKWFKSGQLYSYCMEKYTTFDGSSCQGCTSRKYNDCVSVCNMKGARKGLLKCEKYCLTEECKAGCKFYNYVFNKEGNFSLDETRIPRSNATIIHESQHADNVTFNWAPVLEGHKKLPSVYLITIREFSTDEHEYVLRLTDNTSHTATMDDMCNHIFGARKYDTPSLKFALKVYPVNFNGPSNLNEFLTKKLVITSKYTTPSKVKPVQNISIASKSPYFQIKEGKNNIVWKLDWSKSSVDSRSIGVRYKYVIDSCEISERMREMMGLNLNRYGYQDASMSGYFDVGVVNTKDDHLNRCKIKVDVVFKYGKCFLSDVASKIISYNGCTTVHDYGNPCQQLKTTQLAPSQTNLKNISLRTLNHSCEKNHIESRTCPDNYKYRCKYCLKPKYHVMVSWDSKEIPYIIHKFILKWGDGSGTFLENTSQVVLTGNTTSYIIYVSSQDDQRIKLGVQLHAVTDHSIKSWKWNAPIIKMDLELFREDSRYFVFVPKGISTRTIVVAAILTVAVFIVFASILWKVYKRHMLKQKDDTSVLSDKVFMTPESAIIADEWEINPTSIKLIEEIGEGAFGKVYSATVHTSALVKSRFAKQCAGVTLLSDKTKTAVKLLKPGVQDEEINDFQDEISLMKTIGYHKNIVNIIGCSTIKQPLCLVVEFMHNGDLLNYLREERNRRVNNFASDASFDKSITSDVMMSFTWQISKGMEYLASRNVVHRDLAARNILVGHNNLVKISDFGLSKNLSSESIYLSMNTTRKLPLKWMSVESIFHKEFTTSSDVWSYGVVLFEIVTLGGAPYPFIGHRELCKLLKSGYRMEKPDNCSEEMYDIMCHCWNSIPSQRPTFVELREHFETMMEKCDQYFSLEIDDTKAYYNVASFKSIPSDDEEEDMLPQDYDQNTVKPLEYVKAVDIPVDLDYESKPSTAELAIGSGNTRYISPQSLKPVTDKERTASFDNPNFHFNE